MKMPSPRRRNEASRVMGVVSIENIDLWGDHISYDHAAEIWNLCDRQDPVRKFLCADSLGSTGACVSRECRLKKWCMSQVVRYTPSSTAPMVLLLAAESKLFA